MKGVRRSFEITLDLITEDQRGQMIGVDMGGWVAGKLRISRVKAQISDTFLEISGHGGLANPQNQIQKHSYIYIFSNI